MPIKKSSFERPPAAPIFKPTLKEFEDPLTYIEKIRPVAQKYGICKIISPKQWNPPFAVDKSTFKFRPRVQKLNEVGAQARIRHNFIRSLEAYWEHQNTPFISPVFRGVHIDVFQLHNKVRHYGGTHQVTKNKQWTMLCRELGIGDKSKLVSSQVKAAYEKLIQPYLDFCDNKLMEDNKEMFPDDVAPIRTKGKTATTIATPKMTRSKTKKFKKSTPLSCKVCESLDQDNTMVTCVECDLRFHITCLNPPISEVTSPWICADCLQINCARELSRLDDEVFGFTQSACKYTLDSFATYAENFKKTYFKNKQNVSLKEVEEEYWRLVAAEDCTEDVIVKYGADISSGQTSSGFPTKANRHLFSENDQKYIDSGWNLNNLPVLNKSIFRFVSNDISGMTVPWCYVGMMFSCFCWHIEDHWSYSINYMHTGECKTWYGVPESDADSFEELMRKEAGQLFEKSPDLLHHITTQINPTILIKNNVKVYRTDQAPGEFIVTFPRAYHSGFNQGFNFAEAVNFCPADWLSKGRASVESYRIVKRPSVFSHNELICKMASAIDSLDIVLLKAVYDEIVIIQQEEKVSRKQICTLAHGTCRTERLQLDQITEDERECLFCRTTLYMSGVTCSVCCKNDRMMCLDHVKAICSCATMDKVVLKYRFSLDEISTMVATVKNKLEQYNLWMTRIYHLAKSEFCSSPVSAEEGRVMKNVSQFVENLGVIKDDDCSIKCVEEKPNLEELKMLLQLGQKMNCPELLLDFLEAIIGTCQRAMDMTDQLLKSHRTGIKDEDRETKEQVKNELRRKKTKETLFNKVSGPHDEKHDKLTLSEMRLLVEKLRSLPAHVPQLEEAAQILYSINEWRHKVKTVVSGDEVCNDAMLTALTASGESNLVYLSEYQLLQKMRVYVLWMVAARQLMDHNDRASLPTQTQLKKMRDDGVDLVTTMEIDKIATMCIPLELEEEDEPMNGQDDELSDYRRCGWDQITNKMKEYEKQLSTVISNGDQMQKEADNILRTMPGIITLNGLKALLKHADSILACVVPGIERLKEVQREAIVMNKAVMNMWQQLQSKEQLIEIDEIQALIKQTDSLCIALDHGKDLKSLNHTIESWKNHLNSLFIKNSPNSYLTTPSLLELLFPRPIRLFKLMIARENNSSKLVVLCKAETTLKMDELVKDDLDSCDEEILSDDHKQPRINNRTSSKNRGRKKQRHIVADDPYLARNDNVVLFDNFMKTMTSSDLESFNGSYRDMCIDEMEWMWYLRELNEEKASKDRGGHDFYCICRKRGIDQKGAQVMCDLCQDWFHLTCLGIHNKDMSKKKFLCPQCERSKRPSFEVLLTEKLKLEEEAKMVKIPEHIVLCLMIQRVISFHRNINQLFSPLTELGAVFADYKKLYGMKAVLPGVISDQYDQSEEYDPLLMDTNFLHLSAGKQSRKTPHSLTTTLYPTTLPPVQLSSVPSKETLINIRRLRMSLSEDARRELEEIYIELCLLEVNQPSVTWIWNLYHSLIDDDEDEYYVSVGDKNIVKKEKMNDNFSDLSDTTDNGQVDTEYSNKLVGKAEKRRKQVNPQSQLKKSMKHENLSSSDENKEALKKFPLKRKQTTKKIVQLQKAVKKEEPTKTAKCVVKRKDGRFSKNRREFRDMWEGNRDISSGYYDEEEDVIVMDNVDINKSQGRIKSQKRSTCSTKSVTDKKGTVVPRRQERQVCKRTESWTERSDYSNEHTPSPPCPDTKICIQSKRSRRPSAVCAQSHEVVVSSSSTRKRRRRAKGSRSRNSKRVCNDDCEADECVQQSSDNVNWIACDKCNLWYHWLCIGINNNDEVGDWFLCWRCKEPGSGVCVPQMVDVVAIERLDSGLSDEPPIYDPTVALEKDVHGRPSTVGCLTGLVSCTPSLDHHHHQQPLSHYSDTHYHRALSSSSLSPPPPFLQPECCVQEEVVEMSYN